MRREGFELTVGKPQVRHPRDRRQAARAGRARQRRRARGVPRCRHPAARPPQGPPSTWSTTAPAGSASTSACPPAACIGFRTEFLTETRGTGMLHQRVRRLGPVVRRDPLPRPRVASWPTAPAGHPATPSWRMQERATLFVGPGDEVYEGMIVGENSRAEDMDVNICREKKLTNMRSSAVGQHRAHDAAAPLVAGAGARVHRRGRVRRGDPRRRPAAQGARSTPATAPGSLKALKNSRT